MTDPVPERPILPSGLDITALKMALYGELGRHAVRTNQVVPKDGSELADMLAWSHVTVPQLTGFTTDLDIGAEITVARLSSDAIRSVAGIAGGRVNAPGEGRLLSVVNVGAFNITLFHQSVLAVAENRLAINANRALLPDEAMAFWYDVNDLRWRLRAQK